jgi:hypothetical protein
VVRPLVVGECVIPITDEGNPKIGCDVTYNHNLFWPCLLHRWGCSRVWGRGARYRFGAVGGVLWWNPLRSLANAVRSDPLDPSRRRRNAPHPRPTQSIGLAQPARSLATYERDTHVDFIGVGVLDDL